jgi:cbb3-type cytochrome oxidase subunit 3
MYNPRDVVPESNMPSFPWLFQNTLSGDDTADKMRVMQTLGVPYTDDEIATARETVRGKTEIEALGRLPTGSRNGHEGSIRMTYYDWLGVLSVVMLVMFIGIGWWAYNPKNKTRFDDAANSILDQDPVDRPNGDKH